MQKDLHCKPYFSYIFFGMLEKCNPLTHTHSRRFVTSCWIFGDAWRAQPSHTLAIFWHHVGVCGNAWKVQPSHTSGTFWHHVGLLGMLEKCNPHTLRALFDIMLDFWECWKSVNMHVYIYICTYARVYICVIRWACSLLWSSSNGPSGFQAPLASELRRLGM